MISSADALPTDSSSRCARYGVYDLDSTIIRRRSTRKFLPDRPVPRDLLDEALDLARRAPSNSNIQPWRMFFATGEARERLKDALLSAVSRGDAAKIPPLPPSFQHHRFELGLKVHTAASDLETDLIGDSWLLVGAQVYGSMGIARGDKEARAIAVNRNYEFFGAPLVGIICIDRELGEADVLSVGMYLQTLVLALTARGLGTCAQVSLAGYPEVIKQTLSIPEELVVICGLAVGYADEEFPANRLRIERDPVEKNVTFIDRCER